MPYNLVTEGKTESFIEKLDEQRRARIYRYVNLFKQYGKQLPTKYLKKIAPDVWELRPGDVRLFLTIRSKTGYVVHAIVKKQQKIPKKDLKLAIKRTKEII